jgi:hypothetical protein
VLRLDFGAAGDAPGAGGECARVETVEEWVAHRTGATGEPYVGLGETEAVDRADAAGLETRIAGRDGVDLVLTMDFRPDRLNLLVFDGVVVAAQLDGEEPVAGTSEPGG